MSELLDSDNNNYQYFSSTKYGLGRNSHIIYCVSVVAVIFTFALLPFIVIQISVNGRGIIQSAIERTELVTSVSGRIIQIRMKDNQTLLRGDTLLIIDSSLSRQQGKIINMRSALLKQYLYDIAQILKYAELSDKESKTPDLRTEQYKATWQQFLQESEEHQLVIRQSERVLNRYTILYKTGALTTAEYEKFSFDYDQAVSRYYLLGKRYRSQLEMESGAHRKELSELIEQEAELAEEKELFILKSPVSGSLQNLSGLQNGSYVFANQKIAEISPDTHLIAFCYVKPADIGLIRKGQSVNFQIDAYNHNQWGLLSGKVIDISDDVIFANSGEAVFKVRCSLDSDHMKLKNEYRGFLKKGMNFTARFMVAERTLFQLLYDDAENWLNPNLKEANHIDTYRKL
ncbi:HlyD family efflux transporter periplasmic adaptor subunit [Daejeonella sp. H1SJ63]|jgi:HlyD family secretion protein|uniref:HlyD family secretion protein n=1 Tax=Daejeonella sp. H1SJ63 TaxID=3034145 RepID=UPI0023ED8C79|nr:HlyD family efflux transporter periplasmic adaptor subunit [Daejeonella sp. H1SJ63]